MPRVSFLSSSSRATYFIMTSSNGNIFRVTDPLCGEFTGDRWIPLTKASDAELWCFHWSAWLNVWVNTREADDLRRHLGHYDVMSNLNVAKNFSLGVLHPSISVLLLCRVRHPTTPPISINKHSNCNLGVRFHFHSLAMQVKTLGAVDICVNPGVLQYSWQRKVCALRKAAAHSTTQLMATTDKQHILWNILTV